MSKSPAPIILVVDDSPSMRDFVAASFESLYSDAIIVQAESGFSALKLLPSHSFNLILTDINMPDINGLELIKYIRENPHYKKIPIIIISTENTEEDRIRGIELGADSYLVKPFSPDDLNKVATPFLGESDL